MDTSQTHGMKETIREINQKGTDDNVKRVSNHEWIGILLESENNERNACENKGDKGENT